MQLTSSTFKALVLVFACVEIASAKVYNCPGALNVNVVDDKTMGSCCIGSNDDSCDVTIPSTNTASSSGSSARPAAASTAAFTTVTSSGGSTVTVTSSTKTGGAGKLDMGYAMGALALLAGAALL
ncbi:unnamed protein product [Clonostachys chloroleuca]|uniref:Uncharacterized protein n=1 Tax=Clonostachys chloroleuca TaxID=1926264 RepID=A0AA35VEB8_9HYPO|nr:unnamed protein product [Clonostachys chloroleuca]